MLRSTALQSLRAAALASGSSSTLPGLRAAPLLCLRQARLYSDAHASIMDRGFWKSLVPKPLRKENRKALRKKTKSGEWNPMTFYIVMFLFIGSMSIQMIALRNSTDRYVRQSAVRIGLLKEIVERIQNGEDVDVEKLLGTGDAQKEADWEEVLRAIERDEASQKPEQKQKTPPPPAPPKQAIVETPREEEAPKPKGKSASFGNFF